MKKDTTAEIATELRRMAKLVQKLHIEADGRCYIQVRMHDVNHEDFAKLQKDERLEYKSSQGMKWVTISPANHRELIFFKD